MKKLIIYNSKNEKNLERINCFIMNFEKQIRINSYIWIVEAEVSVKGIQNYLCAEIGINESILVFSINKDWSVANSIDVSDWLED